MSLPKCVNCGRFVSKFYPCTNPKCSISVNREEPAAAAAAAANAAPPVVVANTVDPQFVDVMQFGDEQYKDMVLRDVTRTDARIEVLQNQANELHQEVMQFAQRLKSLLDKRDEQLVPAVERFCTFLETMHQVTVTQLESMQQYRAAAKARLDALMQRLAPPVVHLRDLPRAALTAPDDDAADDASSDSGASSTVPPALLSAVRELSPNCMVCGRADEVGCAHILDAMTCWALGLPKDEPRNFLRLCGAYTKGCTTTACHDLFDNGRLAFQHVRGDATGTQWTVLCEDPTLHGKVTTLSTRPHRRAMQVRFRVAANALLLDLLPPKDGFELRSDDTTSTAQ